MPILGPRQAGSTVYGERAFRFNVKTQSDSIAKVEKADWIFENYARVLCSFGCTYWWTRTVEIFRQALDS
jgi:uncharacterized protein YutD